MNRHISEVVIVQPRAPQMLFLQRKPQGLDKVQYRSRAGAHANSVAGIRRNDRTFENDVQAHDAVQPPSITILEPVMWAA